MTENFVAVTAANCPMENRSAALEQITSVAQEAKAAGASRISYGVTLSGLNPGALVFIQFFESLSGFESVMGAFASSSSYAKVLDLGVQVYLRNIAKLSDVAYTPKLDPRPNYLVMTKGTSSVANAEMTSMMQETTSVFADSGAQTFRFGQILTGDNPGQYLLGITYPSMAAIQNAYDALPAHKAVQKVYGAIDVNMRSIIQIHGMV